MTTEKIIEEMIVRAQTGGSIWGYMYGHPWINFDLYDKRLDELVEIRADKIRVCENCLVYVWGWPGPDANMYFYSDYGKTWAFSKEEILAPNPEEDW